LVARLGLIVRATGRPPSRTSCADGSRVHAVKSATASAIDLVIRAKRSAYAATFAALYQLTAVVELT
jgi:hypothetical protein